VGRDLDHQVGVPGDRVPCPRPPSVIGMDAPKPFMRSVSTIEIGRENIR
jgi:hypothetical protein